MRTLTLAIGLFAVAPAALCHDLWLMPERFATPVGKPLAVFVDVGVKFPIGESPTRADRIDQFTATHVDARADLTNLRVTDTSLVGDLAADAPGLWIVSCTVKPRYIELEPAKFDEYLVDDGLAEIHEIRKAAGALARPGRERYARAVKTFLRVTAPPSEKVDASVAHAATAPEASTGFDRVLGTRVELVPLRDPTALVAGSKLRARVLFDGKPLARHAVSSGRESAPSRFVETVETDANGEAEFALADRGRWYLRTVQMIAAPKDDPDVDWLSFWSTLTFEVR